jgi:hypothetical protein
MPKLGGKIPGWRPTDLALRCPLLQKRTESAVTAAGTEKSITHSHLRRDTSAAAIATATSFFRSPLLPPIPPAPRTPRVPAFTTLEPGRRQLARGPARSVGCVAWGRGSKLWCGSLASLSLFLSYSFRFLRVYKNSTFSPSSSSP